MAELLGGLTGSLQGYLNGFLNFGSSILDRFFPPEKRAQVSAMLSKFATEKPMLASFLLSQIALSGIPLMLFFVMTVTVFIFALLAALLIAILGALLFTVFCVGVALVILLPTLFITTFAGAFIWLWGVGTYFILKWFNEKDIPGIHTSFSEALKGAGAKGDKGMLEGLTTLNGNKYADGEEKEGRGPPPKLEKRSGGGDEKEKKQNGNVVTDKVGQVGKTTGVDLGDVGDVKKKVDVGNVNKVADTKNVSKATDTVKGVTGGVTGGVL
ncbi:MAG: hypothetical protein MMC33_003218 [Icmadophila ericetorum]|nr:hypothetical protein [Icmadophila ericetorum]